MAHDDQETARMREQAERARHRWSQRWHADVVQVDDPEGPIVGHESFEGGGMREPHGDRPRFELLVPLGVPFEEQLLTRCAVHMARGARKYEDRNWEQFSDQAALERARSSALRHLFQWVTGVDDGEDHAAAVVFNLMTGEHVAAKLRRQAGEGATVQPAGPDRHQIKCAHCGCESLALVARGYEVFEGAHYCLDPENGIHHRQAEEGPKTPDEPAKEG